MIKSRETYSKDDLAKILFKGVEVKKSEIWLKSENLHHFILHNKKNTTFTSLYIQQG